MLDNYTFRYLNADGSLNGVTTMRCPDDESAQRDAVRLMPKNAASLELLLDNELVHELGSIQPAHSDRRQDYLNHPMNLPRD
jgi:hypothetical protein